MADAAFWGNQETARTVVQRVKELKGWIEPFDRLADRLTSARELDELLDAEPDASLGGDLDSEAASLATDLRAQCARLVRRRERSVIWNCLNIEKSTVRRMSGERMRRPELP